MVYFINLWELFVDMSFYIVIGLLFTGFLHAFVNQEAILKHVGKNNTASVVKASVLGVPLPLCSCGVVPTALYLGKSGASKGAVVSFLTSTPQTGVDSLIATYGLMGPLFAVFRAVAAFLSGIVSGVVTNLFCKRDANDFQKAKTTGALGEESDEHKTCGCSHSGCHSQVEKVTFFSKVKSAFTYAFGEFLDEIAVHFVIGLFIAALISTLIPDNWLAGLTNPLFTMLLMLLIGIPMYICSTASIPIALSLIMKGISPGAAFVFLFAGPVTNIASLTILSKALGKKVLAIYLSCVAVCAVAFGFVLDGIIAALGFSGIPSSAGASSEHGLPVYMVVIAIGFGVLVLKSLLKRLLHKPKNDSCCSHS